MEALYNPDSVLGKLESRGYVAPYNSLRGTKSKQVNLLFRQANFGYRQFFTDDPDLSSSTIKGISVLSSVESTNNGSYVDATGAYRSNPTSDTMSDMLLCIAKADEEIVRIPLNIMVRTNNNGKYQFFDVSDHVWGDCYIEILNTGKIAVNTVVSLIVYYE